MEETPSIQPIGGEARVRVLLEDFTPYDRCLHWRIHDAYFAARGLSAWTQGEIPHLSTGNFALAQQHADLLCGVLDGLAADGGLPERVDVLEIGSGSGDSAANFLVAMEAPERAHHAARVRYVLSDYSKRSVEEALARPSLECHVARGRLLPALFDVRTPDVVRSLDGEALELRPFAVIASYVCCVTPSKSFRREHGTVALTELWVKTEADLFEEHMASTPERTLARLLRDPLKQNLLRDLVVRHDWRPVDPEAALPTHAGAIARLLDGMDAATFEWPYAFLDCLAALARRLHPEGFVLVNDYGAARRAELGGFKDRQFQNYGNTVNHPVNFAVFDAFAPDAGLELTRTQSPLRSIHVAAFTRSPAALARLKPVFERTHVGREDGEDVVDFSSAAKLYLDNREWSRAIRLLTRCTRLDPLNGEIWLRLAEANIELGEHATAEEHARAGMAADRDQRQDWEFLLGRITCLLERRQEAISWYRASLRRDDHPVTHTNLAVLYEEVGDLPKALRSLRRALALAPSYTRASERLEHLKGVWWKRLEAQADEAHD